MKTSANVPLGMANDKAVSREDTTEKYSLVEHLNNVHCMSPEDYLQKHGHRSPLFGGKVFEEFYSRRVTRKGSESYRTFVHVGGIKLEAQKGQVRHRPDRPKGYRYPKIGAAGRASERIARALKYGRNIYYYGPPGTGKSDIFRALAHDLNLEFSLYPMREDLDPSLYLGQMSVVVDKETGVNKTEFVPGRLLQDIQGRVGLDGVRRPVLILIDDIDRAPAEHNEIYRHLLDGSKEIFVPEIGESLPVFPGTQICATANSSGRGDYGLCSSVQTIDDSLLDRFDRFVEAQFLDMVEERSILEAKFPFLKKNAPSSIATMMEVATTIRRMIQNNEVLLNFSHRVLVNWAESLEEIIKEKENYYTDTWLGLAALDWLERFDVEHREAILSRVLKAYIPRQDVNRILGRAAVVG